MEKLIHFIEVPEDSRHVKVTNLQNPDIVPFSPERRTWDGTMFMGYWLMHKVALSSFTSASTLLGYGLNVPYTMAAVIVSNLMTCIHTILNGQPGADHHIGFTMYSKVIFGTYGFYLATTMRSIISVVWFASQAWLGGLMVNTLLGSLSYHYLTLENTLSDSVPFTSRELIGFILFQLLVFPFLIYRPEKMQYAMAFAAVGAVSSMIGICAFAVHDNGGDEGPLMTKPTSLSGAAFSWAFLRAIGQWYGGVCSGTLNKPDYTRFCSDKTRFISPRYAYVPGTIVSIMILGVIISLLGVITASSIQGKWGKAIWKPSDVMEKWLVEYYTPGCRAGCFFASFCFVSSQLVFNSISNLWAFGMDLSGIAPKFLNIRRGSILAVFLAWVIQPWTMYNTSSNFGTVMSAFSVFFAPMIAIIIADYWIIRRRKLKLTDLYTRDPSNIYYGWKGFNLQGYAAFFAGMTPGLPGLIHAATPTIPLKNEGIIHYYWGNVVFGWFISFFLYIILCFIWKPKGLGEMDAADYYGTYSDIDCKYWGIVPQHELTKEELEKYVDLDLLHPRYIDEKAVETGSSDLDHTKIDATIEVTEVKK